MSIVHPHLKTRRYRVFKDQHGRKWGATIDTTTNDPVENLKPHGGWKAPWLPSHDSVKLVHNETEGTASVDLGYANRKAQLRQAHKAWNERLLKIGYQRGGDDFDPQNPSPAVLFEVGPKPLPIEPVIAAENNDPWILGFSPTMPAWARPFFVKALPDEAAFMAEAELRVAQLNEAARFEDLEDIHNPPTPPAKPTPSARRRRGRPKKTTKSTPSAELAA